MQKFTNDNRKEISAEEILAIEIEHECPFKPFDKVLIRDKDNEEWKPDLFWRKTNDKPYPYVTISGVGFDQCISYEGHEHLIDTNKSPEK